MQRGGLWTDRTVPANGLTTNERLRRLDTHREETPMTDLAGEIIFHPRSAGGRRSGPPTGESSFPTAAVLAAATSQRDAFGIRVHLAHVPSAARWTPCSVGVLVPGAPFSEAMISGAHLLVYEGPHVVGQLRLLGSADETNAHAPGIARRASAEITSLCGDLGGIVLGPDLNTKFHVWANKKWIDYQMMQGKGLVDIGAPNPALRPPGVDPLGHSDYYSMELDRVSGYGGYSQDPQASWDLH